MSRGKTNTRERRTDEIKIAAGPLAEPFRQRAQRERVTTSELGRRALAAFLGLPLPDMRPGNPGIETLRRRTLKRQRRKSK